MKSRHWLIRGRDRLLLKLALHYLPFSAKSKIIEGDGNPFPDLLTDAVQGERADLVYHEGLPPQFEGLFQKTAPAGLLLISADNPSMLDVHITVEKLQEAGFHVESVHRFGFFPLIFLFPLRLLGIPAATSRIPLFNAFYNLLMDLELKLHPHVRFLFGDGIIIMARHLDRSAPPVLDLSIIIPAYNEEKRILPNLKNIRHYLKRKKWRFEILVVDDGSLDRTFNITHNLFPGVRTVRLYRNIGKGGAVKEGVRLSRGNVLLITDADGSTPVQELDRLLERLNRGRHIVIGSRYLQESKIIIRQTLFRRLISRLGNMAIRAITGLPFRDTQCGFKLFRYDAAKPLFESLENLRYGFDFEILFRAMRKGFTIDEVAVEWRDVAGSKVGRMDSIRVFWELLSVRYAYFVRFSLVGIANTVVDYSVHNSLILLFGRGDTLRQSFYNLIGFISANVVSYLFNSGYTFQTHGSYIKFFTVSAITMVLTFFTFFSLNSIFNPGNDLILMNTIKLSTVAVSLVINYFGYKFIVYHKE